MWISEGRMIQTERIASPYYASVSEEQQGGQCERIQVERWWWL